MNNLTGIIATSLLVCFLAGPARAELSETAASGTEAAGHPLSASENDGGQAGINSFLDRFAGTGLSDPSSEGSSNSSFSNILPISEKTLFSSFTRAGSPMNAYYSRTGTDDLGRIKEISRSGPETFTAAVGGDRFVLPGAGLAASVQGYFVGGGAVVGSAEFAPVQAASGDSIVIQPKGSNDKPTPPTVPLPLPFFLTGSGLAALLGLKKRVWNNG
jgi:hypothetical protein